MKSTPKRLTVLLASTTALTYWLILLGIYTAAVGAGLTCEGRWPLCDGAVFGLFPANWPSFVEWFHRLVAMITGFSILGSAYGVLRHSPDRRLAAAMVVVVALLPVQIGLGAETVLGYEPLVLILHFSTAMIIFCGLLYATIRSVASPGAPLSWLRSIGVLIVIGLPVLVLISPTLVRVHSAPYQVAYTGLGLAILSGMAAVIGLTYRVAETVEDTSTPVHVRWLVAGAVVLLILQLVVGRVVSVLGLSAYTELENLLVVPGTAVAILSVLVALWLSYRLATVGVEGSPSPVDR